MAVVQLPSIEADPGLETALALSTGGVPADVAAAVARLGAELRAAASLEFSNDDAARQQLRASLRALVAVCRRTSAAIGDALHGGTTDGDEGKSVRRLAIARALEAACSDVLLLPFLPPPVGKALRNAIQRAVGGSGRHGGSLHSTRSPRPGALHGSGVPAASKDGTEARFPLTEDDASHDGAARSIVLPRRQGGDPALVPRPEFVDTPSHTAVLGGLAAAIAGGEELLLLIGNQGTGKNRVADRLCGLLGWEREYMQLHRDTTVAQLLS